MLTLTSYSADGQTATSVNGVRAGITAGGELENYLRNLQTIGLVPLGAWGLRPFSAPEADVLTNVTGPHPWAKSWLFGRETARGLVVLPISVTEHFNSSFPVGSNNYGVWVGRGLTTEAHGGIAAAWGPLTLVLDPMFFRAENQSFALQPNGQSGNGRFAHGDLPDNIDLPQRFGDRPYSRFDLGQSTLRIDLRGFAAGMTTANQYWGPATTFPVILGNNAAGIPHAFIGTSHPTNVGIGNVQAQLDYGIEGQSDFSPVVGPDTFTDVNRPGRKRFMSGLIGTFSPRGLPGLELGAARFFHQAWFGHIGGAELSSPFEGLLKNSLPGGQRVQGLGSTDVLKNQLASVFARWVLPASGFELYAEYGHEDHNADSRDLAAEPDHSRISTFGFRKVLLRTPTTFSVLRAEYIDGTDPTLGRNRAEGGAYVHGVLLQGHTQYGQLLGADIGAGSPAGAELAWESYTPGGHTTLYARRVVDNNESAAFSTTLAPSGSQHLMGTLGYEAVRFGKSLDFTYGAALTAARRAPELPKETNLGFTIGVRTH